MANRKHHHERIDRQDAVEAGSERAFGLVFAVVIALWPLLGGGAVRVWAAVVTALFALTALLMPRLLRPLNQVWFRFGMLLHRVVSPLVMRLLGKDPLRLRFDATADSYWIPRDPPGPPPDSMRNQF